MAYTNLTAALAKEKHANSHNSLGLPVYIYNSIYYTTHKLLKLAKVHDGDNQSPPSLVSYSALNATIVPVQTRTSEFI